MVLHGSAQNENEGMTSLSDRIVAALHTDGATEDPLYRRLARAMRGLIEVGYLRNRDRLPSERRLAEATGLSRVTVRKAFEELIADGMIQRQAGARSFVSQPIDHSLSVLMGFTSDMRQRGAISRSIILDKSVGMPEPEDMLKLGISPGEQVLRLSRIRLANEEPLAIEHALVPLFAVSPDQIAESLYDVLRENGYRPVRALQRLRSVLADAEEARYLGLPAGSPILHIERHTFLDNGRPIEVTRSAYRGDRYDFISELHLDEGT